MRVLTIVPLLIAAGCALPLDGGCINETRNLSSGGTLEPTSSPGTSTGTALVVLHEARDYRTKQTSGEEFLWSVRAPGIDRSTVSAVHVHERDTDRLLFQIPLENTNAPADVITQTFSRRPHNGAIASWSEVYELIGSGRGYLDVHVGESGTPVMRANLTAQNPNWRDFIHADCS
jgi:hypothetical protein